MTTPSIDELPAAPSRRAQGEEEFDVQADRFVAALPPMVQQTNAALGWIDGQIEVIGNQVTAAGESATAAAEARDQSQQAAQASADSATAASESESAARTIAATVGDAAGLPALTGNEGRALTVQPGADGGDPSVAFGGPMALEQYSLDVNDTYSANATTAVDVDLSDGPQVVIVGNSSLRTVNLNNPPADRSMLVIVQANGSAGLSFTQLPNGNYWDDGEVPEAGAYWTQYLLWYTGSYWRGTVGIKR
ncbi:hypothetical protein [Modicisalibacter coralii]|uniref:hypothetical protein n=1 Tax=Modicisalibacter coralii TaxID=2304602 RepID=UPI00100B3BF1|nr:hypothetical protein [Halomonas coralii]